MAYDDYGLSSMWTPTLAPTSYFKATEGYQDIYNRGIRNKLMDMRLQDALRKGAIDEGQYDVLRRNYLTGQGGQQPANGPLAGPGNSPAGPTNNLAAGGGVFLNTLNSPASYTPWTGSRENYMDVGRAQAADAQQAQQQARIDRMAALVHQLGPQGLAMMKPQLEQMDPAWKNIDPSKLAVQGGVIHYEGPGGGYDVVATPDGHYSVEKRPGAQSQVGKSVADRAALVQQYGEGSPQVKEFDQAAQPNGPKETDFDLSYKSRKARGMTDAQISDAWHTQKVQEQEKIVIDRGAAYQRGREYAVLDTQMGNTPTFLNAEELADARKNEPGRYIPATQGEKALIRTALIEDIRGNITSTRDALKALPEDFTPAQSAQLALIMKQRYPTSALSNFWDSEIGRTLTPEQQDYVINLAQLQENAMAMRSVLGAGQGSEGLKNAIVATLPGPRTPTREYAAKQLDAFERALDRLSRSIPKVKLGDMPNRSDSESGTGNYTQADLEYTAQQYGMTVDEVKKRLGVK
jgi:hypothetical protein